MRRNIGAAAAVQWNISPSGRTGIIYLAWHGKAAEREEARDVIRTSWRAFADQAVEEQNRFGVAKLSSLWLREDLYICMPLPSEHRELLEELLLELAIRFKQDWERRFAASFGPVIGSEELKLHAGIAVVDFEEPGQADELWYAGLKRAIVHGQSPHAPERTLKRKSVERLIAERLISPVYQPIWRLGDGAVFGYEALSRCTGIRWFDGPQQLFAFAREEGLVYALDRLARERAIERSEGLAAGQKLFINLTAQIMNDPSFTPGQTLPLLERYGLSPRNVVFEITERTSIEDFGAAKRLLGHYRSQGYQIAIDDAGAGYSSLQSIVELQPDFIKIDRSLIRGIHLDPIKENIVHTFVAFAAKMGISLVAEGIEEEEELSHMKAMGVQYAQGYLLGRPKASIPRREAEAAGD